MKITLSTGPLLQGTGKGSLKQQAEKSGQAKGRKAWAPGLATRESVLDPQGQPNKLSCGPRKLWGEHDLVKSCNPWLD